MTRQIDRLSRCPVLKGLGRNRVGGGGIYQPCPLVTLIGQIDPGGFIGETRDDILLGFSGNAGDLSTSAGRIRLGLGIGIATVDVLVLIVFGSMENICVLRVTGGFHPGSVNANDGGVELAGVGSR